MSALATAPDLAVPPAPAFGHLDRLESEAIHIIREVAAEFRNPVMLYSIGKDSAVMLHLAMKAFAPGRLPFPLLHVDTTWKFRAMTEFRDNMAREHGFDLIVHINQEGVEKGINPFASGSKLHTDVMKTQALKQALDKYNFDAAFGGARRDEEKSRAKERVFSFRSKTHRWDPKAQRPELWNLYNTAIAPGESVRAFPISKVRTSGTAGTGSPLVSNCPVCSGSALPAWSLRVPADPGALRDHSIIAEAGRPPG